MLPPTQPRLESLFSRAPLPARPAFLQPPPPPPPPTKRRQTFLNLHKNEPRHLTASLPRRGQDSGSNSKFVCLSNKRKFNSCDSGRHKSGKRSEGEGKIKRKEGKEENRPHIARRRVHPLCVAQRERERERK